MKKFLPLIFIFFLTLTSYAQNKSLGVGTPTPNSNAALHVESPTSNQGFIMPRLTTVQRTGMGSLLTTTDNGLMLYDTDLKTIYIWDGATWKSTAQVAGGSKLSYPYIDTLTNLPNNASAIKLVNNNTDTGFFGLINLTNLNPNSNFSPLFIENRGLNGATDMVINNTANTNDVVGAITNGLGRGGAFNVNNSANNSSALYSQSNGTGRALQAVNTGTGAAANLTINNATNSANALFVTTNGTGSAANFSITNPLSTPPGLNVNTVAQGGGIRSTSTGTGYAGWFEITNATNGQSALRVDDAGTGSAGSFSITNAANNAPALVVTTNGTGNAIQTTGKISAGQFIGDGSGLTNLPSVSFPFATSLNNASTLFDVTNTGTGAAISATNTGGFVALNAVYSGPSTGGRAITADNTSTTSGFAGVFTNTQPSNTFPAIQATTLGTGPAIRVIQSPTTLGIGTDIWMQNATSTATGLNVDQQGLGSAGKFMVNNAANTSPALNVETNGLSYGVRSYTTGAENAGYFEINNSANTNSALATLTNTNSGNALYAGTTGGGRAAFFDIFNLTNTNNVITAQTNGLGKAGNFQINNAASSAFALSATTNGTGAAIVGETGTGFAAIWAHKIAGTANEALNAQNDAPGGFAINAYNTNASNTYPAIQANTVGAGPGVRVFQGPTSIGGGMDVFMQNTTGSALGFSVDQQGLGSAGNFNINNVASTATSLNAVTNGTGSASYFEINNVANTFPALYSKTNGTGAAGDFQINNAISTASALKGTSNGTGGAAFFENTNSAASGSVLISRTNSNVAGTAIDGLSYGTAGHGGAFWINNAANNFPAVTANTMGSGSAAVFSILSGGAVNSAIALTSTTNGVGSAGSFTINNSFNNSPGLNSTTNGTGPAIHTNHTGASGDIAIFQSASTNVARINKTGVGYFNGGTLNSGADVAEMFDVEGARESYEPGDVLVISEASDRTVEKSSTINSAKVVGVYATKPGVTLTEKGIDENLDQLVPMGVIGVIPTKVCLENGAIKRGDLLVTSSTSGHAMKAISAKGDGVFPAGVIIGKALENFESGERGLIKVLVNVK